MGERIEFDGVGHIDSLPISVQRRLATDNLEPFRRVARTIRVPGLALVAPIESAPTVEQFPSEVPGPDFTPPEAA